MPKDGFWCSYMRSFVWRKAVFGNAARVFSYKYLYFFWCLENIRYFCICKLGFAKPCVNNMNKDIRHCGIVEKVDAGCTRVRIVQSSACASCKVAGRCHASESKEKTVDVTGDYTGVCAVGDNVTVVVSQRAGMFAVTLSAVVPLAVVMIVLAVALAVTGSEPVAAVSALLSLIPYYILLYFLRGSISSRLTFRIET